MTKVKADVVFCFFGYNEALRGEPGLAGFRKDLGDMLSGMKGQKYNGKSAPQVIVFSPMPTKISRAPTFPTAATTTGTWPCTPRR
ncbi:MAG: hypothetical protein Ct9H300mP1_21670 [Planctomycetaceae bacterium]|nr:MAG: hypothetical protein Ct9H300mP1_21670 [Planctomycetaceae bacterium]